MLVKYRKNTEKYRYSTVMVPKKVLQYRSTGTGDLVRSWGVHRHPYCRGLSLKGLSALGDLRGPLEGPRHRNLGRLSNF